nr:hypothetical protein [Tanacetum cinerariifolium]
TNCGSGELECSGRSATPPMTVEATGGLAHYILDCAKTGCVDDLNNRCPMD